MSMLLQASIPHGKRAAARNLYWDAAAARSGLGALSGAQSFGQNSSHGVLGDVFDPGTQLQGEFPRQRTQPDIEQGMDLEFQLTIQALGQINPQPLLQPGQGRVQLRLNKLGSGLCRQKALQLAQACILREERGRGSRSRGWLPGGLA
ncbi:hypothetical protein THIX_70227 [Thiomonas sp. X19]|nr:hypothetical protein THIX_70227 [Thiomonas sp. X19]